MTHIEEEKIVVAELIRIYCRRKHGRHHGPHAGNHQGLCDECSRLLTYAHARLDRCRFGQEKPSCRRCTIHCYSRSMQERIRAVMRYSGPRIVLYHPTWFFMALRHM